MPSPVYDNKYLADREAKRRLGVTIEPAETGVPAYVEPPVSVDQLLANAKGTLARSGEFLRGITPVERVSPAEDDSPSVFDPLTTRLARFGKRVLEPIPHAAERAANVGMFLAPEVAIPSQMLLGASSAKDLVTGGMDRLREHPFQSVADATMVGLGYQSLKALKELASAGGAVRQGALTFGELSPAAQARNVEAENMVADGFSRPNAGRLNEIPGAGTSKNAAPYYSDFQQPETTIDDALERLRARRIDESRWRNNGRQVYPQVGQPPLGSAPVPASAPKPDLMDEFLATQGPKPSFEMGGDTYQMNDIGSHVAVPSAERARQLRTVLETLGEVDPMFTPVGAESFFNISRLKR